MSRSTEERRIPWPRDRHWRPGEPMTFTDDGTTTTYRLRGVMRDTDPGSEFATVSLEPLRAVELENDVDGEERLAAG